MFNIVFALYLAFGRWRDPPRRRDAEPFQPASWFAMLFAAGMNQAGVLGRGGTGFAFATPSGPAAVETPRSAPRVFIGLASWAAYCVVAWPGIFSSAVSRADEHHLRTLIANMPRFLGRPYILAIITAMACYLARLRHLQISSGLQGVGLDNGLGLRYR